MESDLDKKLKFVQAMTRHGLSHFDAGGTVAPGTVLQGPDSSAVDTGLNTNNNNAIGSALGINNSFKAGAAKLQSGTNADQLNQSYNANQSALAGQQNLASTLAPQASTATANQNMLAAQLQAQANGQGPNVAQNQLNQATGANVSNQAALMAGQRGASSNVGLMARQAAEQGANTQQQAAGQAATLGAQQQIAAQQGLANLSANQISQTGQASNNLTQAQQAEQNILQGANTAYNNSAVSMQSNINNVAAQTAAANASSNASGLGGVLSAASSLAPLLAAEGGAVKKPSPPPPPPDPDKVKDFTKGFNGGYNWAEGGSVRRYADGGITGNPLVSGQNQQAPQSFAGNFLNSPTDSGNGIQQSATPSFGGAQDLSKSFGQLGSSITQGVQNAQFNNAVSSGENEIDQENESQLGGVKAGKMIMEACGGPVKKQLAAKGGKVKADNPKEKAVVKGNDYANDKIPAMLSEGEIVLPREVTQHPDAPNKAAEFVRATLAKKGLKRGLK